MQGSLVSTLFLTAFLGLAPVACLANGQANSDETGLVAAASGEVQVADAREISQNDGGADAGGGNSVGTELFDDYENKGTSLIPEARLRELVEPYLADLRLKVPALADALAAGIGAKKWYLEPKALSQTGTCLNQSVVSVKLVVRACQSANAVRVDENFFEGNKEFQAPLVLHELLVNLQLKGSKSFGVKKITDEMVRELSRTLREPATTAEQIVAAASQNGFGDYLTSAERAKLRSLHLAQKQAYCRHNYKEAEKALEKVSGYENAFGGRGIGEMIQIADEVDVLNCAKKTR